MGVDPARKCQRERGLSFGREHRIPNPLPQNSKSLMCRDLTRPEESAYKPAYKGSSRIVLTQPSLGAPVWMFLGLILAAPTRPRCSPAPKDTFADARNVRTYSTLRKIRGA